MIITFHCNFLFKISLEIKNYYTKHLIKNEINNMIQRNEYEFNYC